MMLALWDKTWGPISSLTVQKHIKENHSARIQPLKNLVKNNVFRPGGPWGAPGCPWGPVGLHGVPMGPHGVPMGPHGAPMAWGLMGPKGYICKLPINRLNGGVMLTRRWGYFRPPPKWVLSALNYCV